MPYHNLTQLIGEYVKGLYKQNHNPDLFYHNLEHTENVVQRSLEIAANYSLTEKELFIILAAAWFHDTGQLFGEPKDHEERSVTIMRDYLQAKKVKKATIDSIQGCILATKLPQQPKTLLEEIICDADTFNLGTKEFIETDKLLKKEFKVRKNVAIDNWEKMTLNLLKKHTFFTSYCRDLLEKGKQKNIEIMRFHLK